MRATFIRGAVAGLGLLSLYLTGAALARPGTGDVVAQRFRALDRDSALELKQTLALGFDAHHPQGLIRLDDRLYLSSVEVLDRAGGKGRGHLFELGASGKLKRSVRFGEGPVYHPGGIDHDGKQLWVPVAEYRPDGKSIVYRVRPGDLRAEEVFRFDDHLGALICDVAGRKLIGVSWGGRRIYAWDLKGDRSGPRDPAKPRVVTNPSHYIDYQDGQHLRGSRFAILGGVARLPAGEGAAELQLGGIELFDMRALRAVHQLPLALRSPAGRPLTQNALLVEPSRAGLRFYFVPEDGKSLIYVYETR